MRSVSNIVFYALNYINGFIVLYSVKIQSVYKSVGYT